MKRFWQFCCLFLLAAFQSSWAVGSRDAIPFISSDDNSVHTLVEKTTWARTTLKEKERLKIRKS